MVCSALLPGIEVANGVCSGAGAPNNEDVAIPGFPNTEPPASFVGWIPKTEVCGVGAFEPRLNVESGFRSPGAAAGDVPEGLENEKLGAAPPPVLAPAVDDDANEKVVFGSAGLSVVDVLVAGNPNGWLDDASAEPQAVLPNALVVGAAGVVVAAGAEAEGVGLAPNPEKVGWVVVALPVAG